MGLSGGFWVALAASLYVLLGWAGFRWRLAQLNRMARELAATLEGAGAKGLALRPSAHIWKPAEVDAVVDGKTVRFTVRQWGRGAEAVGVHWPAQPLPAVWMRRERSFDRMSKALGMEREVQLGDAPFDAAVYVATSAPEAVVKELLAPAAARRAIQDLVEDGFAVVTSAEGVAATRLGAASWMPHAKTFIAVVPRLERLAELLPTMGPEHAGALRVPPSPTRVVLMTLAFVFVPTLLIVPGARAIAPPLLDGRDVTRTLLAGFALWPVAVYLAARALRGRPLAMFELIAVSLGLLCAVPFPAAMALTAANAALDRSAPVEHAATMTGYYRKNTHTIWVGSWKPGREREKIILPPSMPTPEVGDGFVVTTREGGLGWEWVEGVRKE